MGRRAEFQILREIDASSFNNTFQPLGSPLTETGVVVKIQNHSNVDTYVSINGVDNHDFVAQGSYTLYDLRANHGIESQFEFAKNTQFFVKGAAAGAGIATLTVISEG